MNKIPNSLTTPTLGNPLTEALEVYEERIGNLVLVAFEDLAVGTQQGNYDLTNVIRDVIFHLSRSFIHKKYSAYAEEEVHTDLDYVLKECVSHKHLEDEYDPDYDPLYPLVKKLCERLHGATEIFNTIRPFFDSADVLYTVLANNQNALYEQERQFDLYKNAEMHRLQDIADTLTQRESILFQCINRLPLAKELLAEEFAPLCDGPFELETKIEEHIHEEIPTRVCAYEYCNHLIAPGSPTKQLYCDVLCRQSQQALMQRFERYIAKLKADGFGIAASNSTLSEFIDAVDRPARIVAGKDV